MAKPALQRTYKVEIEITVQMDEVGGEHLAETSPEGALFSLKALQQALLADEPELTRQLLSAVTCRLQEYTDRLAEEGSQSPLARLAEQLDLENPAVHPPYDQDFADFTRPLRAGCISARVERSLIQEKTCCETAEPGWKPVREDLILTSELGRALSGYGVPGQDANGLISRAGHHLLARSLTRLVDGVDMEGRCSCGQPLRGIGGEEDAAFGNLWAAFQKHLASCQLAGRIGQNQTAIF